MRALLPFAASLSLALACRAGPEVSPADATVAPPTAVSIAPLFEGLGHYTRPVTTRSVEAQQYFDQGLAWLHGFNHDEAIRSFEQAAALDPECAMAYFGIALASGPHINNPVVPPERSAAAMAALTRARENAVANDLERELIKAQGARFADPPPADRTDLDRAYAEAMRELWQRHPDDPDIGAWFAEAMMDLRPWDLWTSGGAPQPGTEEILQTLENVLGLVGDHPLALHLYIHAVEASPDPWKADAAANALRDLVPAHGHLQHMPSHIDVRRGRWREAIEANAKAVAADETYLAQVPQQNFYRLYMAHNRHMLAYAAMMIGRRQQAVQSMNELVEEIPPGWAEQNPEIADGYTAMPLEVYVRFGDWDRIFEAPAYPPTLPLSRTLRHYARGVAFAATKRPAQARVELEALRTAKKGIDASAVFGNNAAIDIAEVAEAVLEGEILYREGQIEEALGRLRTAVEREDALAYDEPPDWIQPVRHALGAVLLAEKRATEAELVYREDLERLPHNGWALWGLARSLRLQKKEAAAAEIDARLEEVWTGADIELHSSCMCLPGV
jgi:tetratricopeptide (TPR) repeat protein